MFWSIAAAYRPATDQGYLLHEHPGRLHEIDASRIPTGDNDSSVKR
jgi:hypothetical protein